jgi:predicted DNA-binding protein with PD1-like motif
MSLNPEAARRIAAIRHPGPRQMPRRESYPVQVRRLALDLRAGQGLLPALAALGDAEHLDGAVVVLDGLSLGPFDFVLPSRPTEGQAQAAWYSATHVERRGDVDHGTAILGRRDGEWFLHCHAAWHGANGKRHLGHLLPATIATAGPGRVEVLGFTGACFDAAPCAETGFTLFALRTTREPNDPNGTLLRLHPFEDLTTALAEAAAPLSGARAWGIGSLVGATFRDGRAMEDPISEIALLPGCDPAAPHIEAVDTAGSLFGGRLVEGATPVLITAEVLVMGEGFAAPIGG